MQVQAIQSFLTVYETKNMTKASERLFTTQQCISRQIKGIEEELGVELFVRKKTGMQPTEICHRLFPELQKMMGSYEGARAICSEEKTKDAPKLTMALAAGMSNYIDFSRLSTLVQSCTGQDLLIRELPSGECSKLLINGVFDMAFMLEPFDDTMLEHVQIFQDYGYIAMHKNHPLARTPAPIPLSALDGIKLITGISSNCATEHFWRYCSQTNVYPRCVASVTNTSGYVNTLTQDDIAVTILSRSIPYISNPDIVCRQVVEPKLVGSCHCCIRSNCENIELLRGLMLRIKASFDEETR